MEHFRVHTKLDDKHLSDLVALDVAAYGTPPGIAPLLWAEHTPHAYTVFTHNEEPVGYGCILPVSLKTLRAIADGALNGDEIDWRDITNHDAAEGFYYASAVCKDDNPAVRARVVGYTGGQLLRTGRPMLAVAVSAAGLSITQEIGMQPKPYNGPMQGVRGFTPMLLQRAA